YVYYNDENNRYIMVKLFYEEMDHSQDIPAITEEMKQSIFQELLDTQQIAGFHAASSVDSKLIQIQHNYDYENWELFKFPKK
ncbi:MAG: hypothetical protein ABFD00_06520, partial [Chloroherpetonaceae bacterium]